MLRIRVLIVTLAVAMAGLSLAPAHADVIELRGGTVVVRAGNGAVVWSGDAEPAPASIDEVPADAITSIGAGRAPLAYAALVDSIAAAHDLSPALLEALVWQESCWRQGAVSPKGARGLAQLMPATARELGVDAADARANLIGGARYLRRMLDMFDGDVERALAAYNAGPGRVQRARGIPAIRETRDYVARIIDRLEVVTTVSSGVAQ